VQRAELEAVRRAIDECGRPIVLSLSPGETPLERGPHVQQNANMWRISDDFWDRWQPLKDMFGLLDKWTPYRASGAWPDADMLPLGIVDFRRKSRFTPDEQTLCMTLWSITRSPLIFGGDLTQLDAATTALLTNREVLAVNQASANNRELFAHDGLIAWIADVPGSPDKYIALFNTRDAAAEVTCTYHEASLPSLCQWRDLWKTQNVGISRDQFATPLPAHAACLYRVTPVAN
jgi:hypothetical protein